MFYRRVLVWPSAIFVMAGLVFSQDTGVSTPPITDYHFPTYGPSSSLSRNAEPEDGRVSNNVYTNDYFQLRFSMPDGWQEDMKGASPSETGYYSLAAIRGPGKPGDKNSYVYIHAQDMFFPPFPIRDAADFAQRRENQVVNSLYEIDDASHPVQIGEHQWMRLDYNGAGIYRTSLFAIIRCHALSIDFISPSPEILKQLDNSAVNLSLPDMSDLASSGGSLPVCIKNYANISTVIHRVAPEVVGPRFTQVPTRFVIDTNGKVKHIHVIDALPAQAKSVEDALAQWVFKPYVVNGHPVEVETGILFKFPPKDGGFGVETATSSY